MKKCLRCCNIAKQNSNYCSEHQPVVIDGEIQILPEGSKPEKKQTKWYYELLGALIAVWLIGCGFALMAGIFAGTSNDDYACHTKYHSDLVFPTRQVGCWLTEEVD